MEEKITYFEQFGPDNTEQTLNLALERAKARQVTKIVIASTRGETARTMAKKVAGTGIKLVVVPHQYGFGENQRFPKDLVTELQQQGHVVHFGTMLFHTDNLYGSTAPRLMATLLRTFSQGMKVVVELIMMAADGGHIALGEKVVVVTGTGRGADTAVVALAAPSNKLTDMHILEIICKPLQTRQGPPSPPPQTPPSVKPAA